MGGDDDRAKSAASQNGSESEVAAAAGHKEEQAETGDISGTQFPSVVELNVGGQVLIHYVNKSP